MRYKLVIAAGHEQISDQIKKFDEVEVVEENNDIEILEEVLEFIEADYAIINTMLSAEKSLKFARRAKEMHVKVICIVDDEKIDKELILGLASNGVTATVSLDELYRIPDYLESYPEKFDYLQLEEDTGSRPGTAGKDQAHMLQKKKITVAVLGVMPRIGTTTQALRLTKYLNDQGYKAAYIELNDSDYIRQLVETYEGAAIDEELGKITYADLDMFYKPGKIPEILKMPYMFYIYDFGDIHGLKSREQVTWLEKEIKVLAAGTKPNEIKHMEFALEKVYHQNTKYIFSFSDTSEHDDVKMMMKGKADVTYFAPWTPDPFNTDTDAGYLADMMADSMARSESSRKDGITTKNKQGIFRRKKK